jgi:DNA-directed RNA polymerase specialized sigma24 family protein
MVSMRDGDRSPETVEGLVRALSRNRPRLKFLTASFRLRREEAEDLLQDLALVALRKLEEIQDVDGWLLGTARNLCLMRVEPRVVPWPFFRDASWRCCAGRWQSRIGPLAVQSGTDLRGCKGISVR